MPFFGFGNSVTKSNYSVKAVIKSRDDSFSYEATFVTLPEITSMLPSRQKDHTLIPIPNNLTLADPELYKMSEIEILLGNKLSYLLLRVGQIRFCNNDIAL